MKVNGGTGGSTWGSREGAWQDDSGGMFDYLGGGPSLGRMGRAA